MSRHFLPIYAVALLLLCSWWAGQLPLLVPALYLVASLVSFYLYYRDKRAAMKGDWRVPESTLHLSSLLFGWPGSIAGQQLLRHKTSKASFRTGFWIMVMMNLAVLGYAHSTAGSRILRGLVHDLEYELVAAFGISAPVELILQLTRYRILI